MKNVGLWIDHHKAVMVTIENEREKTQEIISNMEEQIQFSNGTPSTASRVIQESTAKAVWGGGVEIGLRVTLTELFHSFVMQNQHGYLALVRQKWNSKSDLNVMD